MSDQLLKFLFRNAPVRGEIVRLHDCWQQMIANHGYPPPVIRVLGEMAAAAALLAANIKFNGTLAMQIQGDGPVRLLVVEVRPQMRLRATAKLGDRVALTDDATLQSLVNPNGNGRCAITLDPADRHPGQQPYQGVVPLLGETIAEVLQTYLQHSEQIHSRLWLAADETAAGGVLLQKLPREGGLLEATDVDAWDRVNALTATITTAELRSLEPAALAHRLYWQERLEHHAPVTPRFECTCSRQRIGRMLVSLGQVEVESIVAEQGKVEITCDFCNARHMFDPIDVGQLFATGVAPAEEQQLRH